MKAFKLALSGGTAALTVDDYRRRARRALPRMVSAFVEGGADGEAALRGNRTAFDQWSLRPRVLTGVDDPVVQTKVGDASLSMPVLLAPTGMTGMVHWSGERAAARAAERAGVRAVLSTAASYTLEEVAEATEHDHFFQLYPIADGPTGSLVGNLLARARDSGYRTLFVTVDLPVGGNRLRERREGMGVPPTLTAARALDAARRPRWCYGYLRHQRLPARMLVDERGPAAAVRSAVVQQSLMRPGYCWDDVRSLRDLWSGPIVVKGVLHPDDAEQAVQIGLDGVMVSNHGGRQLDGVPASLDALVEVVERVDGRIPVLLDGGVRTGTDVVKALALGATAVGIGRPYLYGLAADGQDGVEAVLAILREELVRTLTLMGVGDVSELNRHHLVRDRTGTESTRTEDPLRIP